MPTLLPTLIDECKIYTTLNLPQKNRSDFKQKDFEEVRKSSGIDH